MLKCCQQTRALRHELLPIADYGGLLCFHGLEVLQFLAVADLYGSVDLYVTPYPPADAALALIVVAATAAASVAPVENCAGTEMLQT